MTGHRIIASAPGGPEVLAWTEAELPPAGLGMDAPGVIDMRIDQRFPLHDAAAAHLTLEAGQTTG